MNMDDNDKDEEVLIVPDDDDITFTGTNGPLPAAQAATHRAAGTTG